MTFFRTLGRLNKPNLSTLDSLAIINQSKNKLFTILLISAQTLFIHASNYGRNGRIPSIRSTIAVSKTNISYLTAFLMLNRHYIKSR